MGFSKYYFILAGNPEKVIVGPHIYAEGIDINSFGEVLTSSWRKNESLQIWDYETKELKLNIDTNLKVHGKSNQDGKQLQMISQFYCCKFSKDFGKLIFAGGSSDNMVRIYTYKGDPVASIYNLSGAVICLDSTNIINKNEQLLAFGGGEGRIRIFKIKYNSDDKF